MNGQDDDRYKQLEARLVDEQLEGGGNKHFSISQADLLEIVNMQNRPKHGGNEAGAASTLIMETWGGPDGLAKHLKTSTETGINWNDQERINRVDAFGPNSFPPPKIKTLWELIMENFEDQINRILLGAALVSLVIGCIQHGFPDGMLEGVSIMIALCIIIIVSSGNNYASERRLANLVAMADRQEVAVYRKGKNDETTTISYEDLVVGDLVQVEKGMKVPADCMLVQGDNVQSKEDALTGEPDDIDKTPLTEENYRQGKDSIMFAKAIVTGGKGKAIVLAVGDVTEAGQIQKKVQEEGESDQTTLLQKKLNTIANQIGNVGYACAALTFVAILIRLILELADVINCGCKNLVTCEAPEMIERTNDKGETEKVMKGCEALDMLDFGNRFYTELLNTIIIAITVIVVAIPEGLPLAVTISLSFSSAKMQKENNLVRKLASAETMGAVTHICSDKTGTLTQNIMTTMACMSHQKSFTTKQDNPNVKQLSSDVSQGIGENGWELLKECALWNSAARIEVPERKEGEEGYTGVEKNSLEYQGNVTDQGILKFFAGNMGMEAVRSKMLERTQDTVLTDVPFDSQFKRTTTVVLRKDGTVRVYTKGAPDVLYGKNKEIVDGKVAELRQQNPGMSEPEAIARAEKQSGYGMVSRVQTTSGPEDWFGAASGAGMNLQSLDGILKLNGSQQPQHEDLFQATVKDFANQAYRTILCCYKDMSRQEYENLKSEHNDFETPADRRSGLEQDLIAIGLFGIQDPLRDTIVESVKQVKKAGISVIMCTGDNLDTATAISKNAGIITQQEIDQNPETSRMEGQTFRQIVGSIKKLADPEDPKKQVESVGNQAEFNRIIKHLRVLGRSSPQDKYLLVTGLQRSPFAVETDQESGKAISSSLNFCSVAVTGDGTNDAPALSKADVGFSMGITGTDIAKGASDIILLDDNFASIITALRYGRNIYDNVRKFLQFQLTVNIVAMFIVFFGSVMLSDSPLTAVQMLWVNLIMDTLAALALATEPPDESILARMPQPSSTSIVTDVMWRNVHGHAFYQMAVLIVILFAAQGGLVANYDVKCLKETDDMNKCKEGGLNPWFTADLYYELETKVFWENELKGISNTEDKFSDTLEDDKMEAYAKKCRKQCDENALCNGSKVVPGTRENNKTPVKCNLSTYKDVNTIVQLFESKAWAQYQCAKVQENFSDKVGDKVCDESSVQGLLNENLKGDYASKDDYQNKYKVAQAGENIFFVPWGAEKGTGTEKLLHMTYVFQIFVFMQIFNQLNARLLTGSFNIFEGICRNWLFVAVAISTFVIQMAMVEVGGRITKTYPLEMWRNGVCLAFGAGELFWGVFIKLLPLKWFQCINFNEKPMTEEEQEKSVIGKMKSGSSYKFKNKMENQIGTALTDMVKQKMDTNN